MFASETISLSEILDFPTCQRKEMGSKLNYLIKNLFLKTFLNYPDVAVSLSFLQKF